MEQNRLLALLQHLQESKCQFIVVGGLAAVLHGAPVQTYDVDIVYSQDLENVACLLRSLDSLDAVFRMQPERRLKPAQSHLLGGGHLNLLTRYGPLDLLAAIGHNLIYADLLTHCSEMEIADHLRIQVLHLATVIELKEQLGGAKDLAVLPILRQTLIELKKKRQSPS